MVMIVITPMKDNNDNNKNANGNIHNNDNNDDIENQSESAYLRQGNKIIIVII